MALAVLTLTTVPARSELANRPPTAQAWIVVDVGTGAVVDASSEHTRMRPASVVKVLTALVAVRALRPDTKVPVSATAARMPPERIGMTEGQLWPFVDTLHALLMVSANDAAVSLAEAVSGSRAGFAAELSRVAADLGTVDQPILDDPAGLDDSSAFGGGDQVSAYDLAVMARAALAVPAIRDVVADRQPYRFTGPDGVKHALRNQNKLLGVDPSAVGVKPGYTKAAGETLIAAATRGGRTMLTVELGSTPEAMYSTAETLLDRGFGTPAGRQGQLGYLPSIRDSLPGIGGSSSSAAQLPRLPLTQGSPGTMSGWLAGGAALAVVGALGAAVIRRKRQRQRMKR